MIKRVFDFVAASIGLIVLLPVMLVAMLAIKCTSRGPVLFGHRRVGRSFRPFNVYKFRTMVADAATGGPITWGGRRDPRITRVGQILRATKIDELPQLLNVLKGEMSLVGPRPEVEDFVKLFRDDYREILQVRPGITDFASLKFRDEAAVMASYDNPQDAYVRYLLPEKIELAKDYIRRSSFTLDMVLILRTLLRIVWPPRPI